MKKIIHICLFMLIAAFSGFAQEQYELDEIAFEGNESISSSTLAQTILSEESPGWFWKFLNSFTPFGAEPVYFDSSQIPTDLAALEQFYNNNGFFMSEFSYSYEVDTTDMIVKLTYKITEGLPSQYGAYNITGLDTIPENILKEIHEKIEFDSTEQYSQIFLQQEAQTGLGVLQNNGYMLSSFDSSIIYRDTSLLRADMRIFYTPNKRYTIDTVFVEVNGDGAPSIDRNLLREIAGIESGEYYKLNDIRLGQTRLFRTQLFNSVLLTTSIDDTSGNTVPLKLEGDVGYLNELSPEFIINNQQNALNVGLGATYRRKNFFGRARRLTLNSSFGIQDIFHTDLGNLIRRFSFRDTTLQGYVEARAVVEQPFLFGKQIFGTWENYATINKRPLLNNTIYGSKITFDFELPTETFFNYLSTFYNVEQSEEVYRNNRDSLSSKFISIIGADFGRTTANDLLFPTGGYLLSFQVQQANAIPYLVALMGPDDYEGTMFYKLVLNNAYYLSLSERNNAIFAAKLKAGHIQTYYGGYEGIPLNRTFYTGGSNSIRGWRSNELPGENEKGGTFLLEGSLEYRYRFMENIGTALFFDFGNSFIGYDRLKVENLAAAVGIGFRYYTAVAPFRLDFGFKLYDPDSRLYLWETNAFKTLEFHFGIGEAF